jgi:F-type H+-transporting ATPase subunit alpha
MQIKAEEISKIIRDTIGNYAVDVDVAEVGTVVSVGDGIARLHGLERTMAGEMIEFPHGVFGIALNLEEDWVTRRRSKKATSSSARAESSRCRSATSWSGAS